MGKEDAFYKFHPLPQYTHICIPLWQQPQNQSTFKCLSSNILRRSPYKGHPIFTLQVSPLSSQRPHQPQKLYLLSGPLPSRYCQEPFFWWARWEKMLVTHQCFLIPSPETQTRAMFSLPARQPTGCWEGASTWTVCGFPSTGLGNTTLHHPKSATLSYLYESFTACYLFEK